MNTEKALDILLGERWPGFEVDCFDIANLIREKDAIIADLRQVLDKLQQSKNLYAELEELKNFLNEAVGSGDDLLHVNELLSKINSSINIHEAEWEQRLINNDSLR